MGADNVSKIKQTEYKKQDARSDLKASSDQLTALQEKSSVLSAIKAICMKSEQTEVMQNTGFVEAER